MAKFVIRVARELEFEDIKKHLLIVGELTGDCFSCRQVGIDYSREKYCPQCKTDFRFISYRKSMGSATAAQVAKISARRPDLTYVEYNDIKEISDRQKAKNIFKS